MVCSRQREEVQHQEDEVVRQTQQKPAGRLPSRLARGDQAEEGAGPAEMVMPFEFATRLQGRPGCGRVVSCMYILLQVLHKSTAVQDFMWNILSGVLLELPVQHSGCRQVSRV